MIASTKEIDALNITLFNSCINFTNLHLCNYCTKIFVIVVNTCVCRRSVDNKALILSYPILMPQTTTEPLIIQHPFDRTSLNVMVLSWWLVRSWKYLTTIVATWLFLGSMMGNLKSSDRLALLRWSPTRKISSSSTKGSILYSEL